MNFNEIMNNSATKANDVSITFGITKTKRILNKILPIKSTLEKPGKFCSKCGSRMNLEEDIVYTSEPPMFGYICPECGNKEYDLKRMP